MFNLVDVILIVIIIWFSVAGYLNGLLKALGGVVSFILAMIAGSLVTSFLIRQFDLNPFELGSTILLIIAFGVTAFVVGFGVGIVVGILEGIRKAASFVPFSNMINGLLGALFGFIEGIIFVSAVLIFTAAYSHDGKARDAVLGSQTADWLSGITQFLSHIFPTVTVVS